MQKGTPERGKLRTFVLEVFRHMQVDWYRRMQAGKRGGGKITSLDAEDAAPIVDDKRGAEAMQLAFDRDWALTLWERMFDALSKNWTRAGKGEQFLILVQSRVINRNPHKLDKPDNGKLAAELGKSNGAVRVQLFDLRSEIRMLLLEEVRQTLSATGSPEQDKANLKEEFSYLLRVLYSR